MLPRINEPEGIQTADYLFKGEYWDLKSKVEKVIKFYIIQYIKRKLKAIILFVTYQHQS